MVQSGGVRPESELETLLTAALSVAFPGLPRNSFTNQTRFTVTLGREEHAVDGLRLWQAEGRADIIISKDGRPLAVVEVKRQDKALRDDDRKQGRRVAGFETMIRSLSSSSVRRSSRTAVAVPFDDTNHTVSKFGSRVCSYLLMCAMKASLALL
jgi:hypothetical protein